MTKKQEKQLEEFDNNLIRKGFTYFNRWNSSSFTWKQLKFLAGIEEEFIKKQLKNAL